MIDFVLRSTGKEVGDHGIKWGGKPHLYLDYADDLGILDESVSKINEFLEVLRVHGATIGLKINVKKTKSLRLGISEDENVTRWAASLTLAALLAKTVGAVKILK